jgi:putative transcriptional regulator
MTTTMEGKFLIASPYLQDPNFKRSVVFIVKHDDEEALGFIINYPSKLRLPDLLELAEETETLVDCLVYRGGPVNGPLMALHEIRLDTEDQEIAGLAVSVDKQLIIELVTSREHRLRVFFGYAGWGPGQLEAELEEGGWLVTTATRDRIFADNDNLWEQLVVEIGRDIMTTGIDARHIPDDPTCN